MEAVPQQEATEKGIFAASVSLEHLSMSVWADIAPLNTLAAPLVQYLVAQVAS